MILKTTTLSALLFALLNANAGTAIAYHDRSSMETRYPMRTTSNQNTDLITESEVARATLEAKNSIIRTLRRSRDDATMSGMIIDGDDGDTFTDFSAQVSRSSSPLAEFDVDPYSVTVQDVVKIDATITVPGALQTVRTTGIVEGGGKNAMISLFPEFSDQAMFTPALAPSAQTPMNERKTMSTLPPLPLPGPVSLTFKEDEPRLLLPNPVDPGTEISHVHADGSSELVLEGATSIEIDPRGALFTVAASQNPGLLNVTFHPPLSLTVGHESAAIKATQRQRIKNNGGGALALSKRRSNNSKSSSSESKGTARSSISRAISLMLPKNTPIVKEMIAAAKRVGGKKLSDSPSRDQRFLAFSAHVAKVVAMEVKATAQETGVETTWKATVLVSKDGQDETLSIDRVSPTATISATRVGNETAADTNAKLAFLLAESMQHGNNNNAM